MTRFAADFRFALRTLWKSPAVALAPIALGLGTHESPPDLQAFGLATWIHGDSSLLFRRVRRAGGVGPVDVLKYA